MIGGENSRKGEGISPRPTVLLVDDEPLIQWSLGEAIREAGYPVQVAASAADTRRLLVRLGKEPLVVVLDLRLPDVVDLSLLQMLRARRPDAPVVVLSAWASADTAADAMAAGAARVMKKPFDVASVVAAVDDASRATRAAYTC
jgi:DNA-binding NtrC family response regulator